VRRERLKRLIRLSALDADDRYTEVRQTMV
jgi:hypothetical protein